jgi:hypothetical protein
MKKKHLKLAAAVLLPVAILLPAVWFGLSAQGSDHADTPNLIAVQRHDARITDLYAFRDGDDLVIALCMDPTVPPGVSEYHFQPDAMFEINIDNKSAVNYDDADANSRLGGSVTDPGKINDNIAFRVTFEKGVPRLRVRGIKNGEQITEMFAGLRDDPFIRGPRIGRNVAAIVLKVPFSAVLGDHPELLIWAYSRVPEIDKPIADHAGMALRSMFGENMPMNEMHPRFHLKKMGKAPDVIIYDTAGTEGFPNGRLLTDDVVDLVGDMRVMMNDDPFPTMNDVPFLTEFPYLAPPQ